MSKNTRQIQKKYKLAVYIRDKFECVYCGKDLRNVERSEITVDHVICRVHGGTNRSKNLVTACKECNESRGCIVLRKWATGSMMQRVEAQRLLPINQHLKMALKILRQETIK